MLFSILLIIIYSIYDSIADCTFCLDFSAADIVADDDACDWQHTLSECEKAQNDFFVLAWLDLAKEIWSLFEALNDQVFIAALNRVEL